MNQQLQVFSNAEFGSVRTMTIDGKPYFVGRDVATVLGYAKPQKALTTHVDRDDAPKWSIVDSAGRKQKTILINESGLYSLILSSKLPRAKEFKRWVTSEVLPTIRRHGAYATDELLNDPDLFIKVLQELKAERARTKELDTLIKVKEQQIAELQPKATYYDLILQCADLVSATAIAKDYGYSAKKFNQVLHDYKIQFKQGDQWFLYAKYSPYGYTHTKTQNYNRNDGTIGARAHTYWTQKGRLFIYHYLKNKGILPIIERSHEHD